MGKVEVFVVMRLNRTHVVETRSRHDTKGVNNVESNHAVPHCQSGETDLDKTANDHNWL